MPWQLPQVAVPEPEPEPEPEDKAVAMAWICVEVRACRAGVPMPPMLLVIPVWMSAAVVPSLFDVASEP